MEKDLLFFLLVFLFISCQDERDVVGEQDLGANSAEPYLPSRYVDDGFMEVLIGNRYGESYDEPYLPHEEVNHIYNFNSFFTVK